MKEYKKRGSEKSVFLTKNARETKKAGALLANEIVRATLVLSRALVVALIGDLGSGKTTFTQGFARGLGSKERVLSPTFVLMRQYPLQKKQFSTFIHIDCYRLDDSRELFSLGWQNLRANPANLILVEWADRIPDALPDYDIIVTFDYGAKTTRLITINETKRA